jgi:hypothetical protein
MWKAGIRESCGGKGKMKNGVRAQGLTIGWG